MAGTAESNKKRRSSLKQYIASGLTLLFAGVAAVGALVSISDWWHRPKGERLSLYFSEWKVPFPCDGPISPPTNIVAEVTTQLRLAVRDANIQHPLIRDVYVELPARVKVTPHTDSGRVWIEANSSTPGMRLYACHLDYRVPVGEHQQFLPVLDMTFPEAGTYPIGYAILADQVDAPSRCRSSVRVQ